EVSALLRGRGRKERLEELTDEAEREFPLQLTTPCRQHPHIHTGGDRACLSKQTRLADAGAPLDRGDLAVPVPGGVEKRTQHSHIGIPLEQRRLWAAGGVGRRRLGGDRLG